MAFADTIRLQVISPLRENAALLMVCVATALIMLGQGVIGPVLPLYAKDFGVSAAMVGASISVFGLARILINLPAGMLSDRFGWPEMVDMVAQAYNALEPADQERCAILCANYGEAGAINFFGSAHGLPRAISGRNSYFLWGPQGATGEVMLVYWHDSGREQLEKLFESVTEVGHFEHPYVMPYENNRTLLLCRGLKIPMEEFWQLIKLFI